jgi:hypothetical protein
MDVTDVRKALNPEAGDSEKSVVLWRSQETVEYLRNGPPDGAVCTDK